jgi:hypothetical protein
MYTSIDGAKKRAKSLYTLFDRSGLDLALNKCHAAVARGGGYQDWHGLEQAARTGIAAMDPALYRQRLISALPEPCRPLALSSLESRATREKSPPDGGSADWLRFVFPYVMASAVLHRSGSAMLRPGSGKGQRLRERLVLGVLVGDLARQKRVPRLDPETLEILIEGSIDEIFADEARHPDFELQFDRLVIGGIWRYQDGTLRILPPQGGDLSKHVSEKRAGKAAYFVRTKSREAAMEALGLALAGIGVADAWRVAEAIVMQGSPEHIFSSGPTLELLSRLAEEGSIETLSKACGLFGIVHPNDAQFVRTWIPGKILNGYLIGNRGLNAAKFVYWASANTDWTEKLVGALDEPSAFVRTIDAIMAEVRAA